MGDPATVGALMADAIAALEQADISTARLDARILLRSVTGISDAAILVDPTRSVPEPQVELFRHHITRRCAHEPVGRILGQREFWSLPFHLSPDTLEPRADTETLVEWVLELFPDPSEPRFVWDIGTGSGCILLALLHERLNWRGIGSDLSVGAVKTAFENALNLGLADRTGVFCGDWAMPVAEGIGLDLIVSNPPYIAAAEIPALSPEVRSFDPINALTDHKNGLSAYGALASLAKARLKPGGCLIVEHGKGQEAEIVDIFKKSGLQPIGSRADLAGINRCVAATT